MNLWSYRRFTGNWYDYLLHSCWQCWATIGLLIAGGCTTVESTATPIPRPPLPAVASAPIRSVPTTVSTDDLPIYDTHMHYSEDAWARFPVEVILGKMESVTVTHALVSSSPDEGTRRLQAAAPDRIVPFLRPYHANVTSSNWTNFADILTYFTDRLNTLNYGGLGEVHLHTVSVNSPVFQQTARLAVEQGLYLHIHADAATIRAVFTVEPEAKVLWAHAGLTETPESVSQLLDDHETVWVDISIREVEIAPNGLLDPAWEALFLRHPDRITIGSDTWIPPRWEAYEQIIRQDRAWLEQLPPEIAAQIAHENAKRLFGTP